MTRNSTLKYRADIDGLRALAVAPVVLYHVGFGTPGGFAGVDVFFVISGYLITAILMKEISGGDFSIIRFYERRARRLFPALFAMLVITTLMASIWLVPDDLISYAESAIATLFFVSNIFFYQEVGYFNELAHIKPLLHTWSLGVEEQFYLMAPVALAVLWKLFPPAVLKLTVIVAVLASFLAGVWLAGHHAGFYLPFARAWELGIGMLLALWSRQINSRVIANILGALGIALLVATFAFATAATPWPGVAALAPCVGAGIIILSGTHSGSIVSRILSKPMLVGLGKISYSLYLWHWPVIVFARYGRFEALSGAEKILLLLISVGLSLLSWRFIEQPVRRKRFFESRRSVVTGSALATVSVVVLAGVLIWFEGLPNRVSPALASEWKVQRSNDPDGGCHGVSRVRVSKGDLCVRGAASASPSFVLVGDSHARALSPAVFAAASRMGISGIQFTGPGFVPTPERYRIGSVTGREIHDSRVDVLLRFLEDRPDIEVVIVTGWWHRYVTGQSYREQPAFWVDDECADRRKSQCNASSFERSLMRLAERLQNRTIVFLDDVPVGWGLHPESHFRAAFRGNVGHLRGISLESAEMQFESYAHLLQAVADANPNVKFSPVILDRLCDDSCAVLDAGGKLIFSDGDHLTRYGAELLVDAIEGVFRRLLTKD